MIMRYKYTTKDMLLMFLYARRQPVKRWLRLHSEMWFAINTVFGYEIHPIVDWDVRYRGTNICVYSDVITEMVYKCILSQHIDEIGEKSSNNSAILITHKGARYIENKFDSLSNERRNSLVLLREQLETRTLQGVLNLIEERCPI